MDMCMDIIEFALVCSGWFAAGLALGTRTEAALIPRSKPTLPRRTAPPAGVQPYHFLRRI